jgi:hypothetical protein
MQSQLLSPETIRIVRNRAASIEITVDSKDYAVVTLDYDISEE